MRDYRDLIAIMIATTFCIILLGTLAGVILFGRSLNETSTYLFIVICSALIGIVAAYVGERFIKH